MKDAFQAILNDFGAKIGIDLPLSAEGQVAIGIDETELGLSYVEGTDELHLHTIIGALPDEPTVAFLSVLMAANHMGAMTEGGAIGCDLEEQLVTLNRRIPAAWLTLPRFETLIEGFADLAAVWRDNYAALITTAEAAEAAGTEAAAAGGDSWIRM
mgnify:CR=1 FL=1